MDTNLVLVGIDRPEYSGLFGEEEMTENPTLNLLQKNYPWSRSVWAELITKLADAGAKVVVLDLYFGAQGDGDEALKYALNKYSSQVVIGCNLHDVDSSRGESMTLDIPNKAVLGEPPNVLFGFDDRIGYVNIWPDSDAVVRTARYQLDATNSNDLLPKGTILESLDARAIRKYGCAKLIPSDPNPVRFRFAGEDGKGYRIHSIADVLGPKTWKNNYQNGAFFRGKIVMVGPTADIFQDSHKIPGMKHRAFRSNEIVQEMLGPEIHLNIIGAALHDQFLRELEPYQEQLCIALAGLLAALLSFLIRQPFRRLGVIVLVAAGFSYLSLFLFDHVSLIIPVAQPLLVLLFSGVVVLGYDFFREQLERSRVRKTLERYVSKNIVAELLDNPETYLHSLEGVRRPAAILFSDVRGFTSMTENADSVLLVKQLNEYLEEMVSQVFANKGTLDKFIGDAVMAVWGNIVTQGAEKDAQNAVATALAMLNSLAKLNADWKARGLQELKIGIGINHGEVICGNMGSTEKMEFTVIGDAVNTASRLEGLTKQFHLDLLLGESTAQLVRGRFLLRTVGLIQLKGKMVPAEVYTVLCERSHVMEPGLEEWIQEYEAAVALFRQRAFVEAEEKFKQCLERSPGDFLCEKYIQECQFLVDAPSLEAWSGVFVMTEK